MLVIRYQLAYELSAFSHREAICLKLRLALPKKVAEWTKAQQSDQLAQVERHGTLERGQGVDSNLAFLS